MKSNYSSRGDRYFFPCLGIAAWPLWLVTQLKVAESRELHAVTTFQRVADFFEKGLDHVLGLTLVETDLLKQQVRKFCFGQRHFPPSDAQFRCECLLQVSHQLLHGGVDFGFEQCFLSILHHYPEGKAFLADLNPVPDIDVKQSDVANDSRTMSGKCIQQWLQFQGMIDNDGQISNDRWLARNFGVVRQPGHGYGIKVEFEKHGGQWQFIFLLPLRMQFANKANGLASNQNPRTAARMQCWMYGL